MQRLRHGKNKLETATQNDGGARPQARKNYLPISYLTKEAKLWRFLELDSFTGLRHKKNVLSSKTHINIFLKSHPFIK